MMIVDNDGIKKITNITDNGAYLTETIITKEAFVKAYNEWIVKDWLSTFNTDSATECFTAVQRLKEKIND